jgi:endonuclease YncB( thermonuclease family)
MTSDPTKPRGGPLLAAICCAMFAGCSPVSSPPAAPAAIVDRPAAGVYAVDRVIDGDTLRILVPLADGTLLSMPVRLLGIDTPERGQPGFAEATADLVALVDRGAGRVRIHYPPDVRATGKYGRLLARVSAAPPGGG